MLLVFGLVVLLLLAVGSVIAVVELTDRGRIATTPDEVLGVGVLIGGVLVAVGAAIVFWAMLGLLVLFIIAYVLFILLFVGAFSLPFLMGA